MKVCTKGFYNTLLDYTKAQANKAVYIDNKAFHQYSANARALGEKMNEKDAQISMNMPIINDMVMKSELVEKPSGIQTGIKQPPYTLHIIQHKTTN